MGSCGSPVAVSEALSSEVELVKSSISALSVGVCLLLPSDVMHSGWRCSLVAFMPPFSWQSNLGFAAMASGVPGKCILERLPAQVKQLFPRRSRSVAQLL